MITPIGRHVLQLRNDPEWMAAVFGAMGVSPNAAQWPIVDAFRAGVRTLAIGGGERSGKSMIAAACAALDMGPESEDFGVCPPRRYWIVGPDYRQCRAEFLYIHDALKALGALRRVSMPQSEDFGVCPPRRYWIVGPDYRQCRAEFLYIHDALKALGALRRVSMPQS